MECPRCSGVEMDELSAQDAVIGKCPECGSLWMDSGDLTRFLLRHNLPGLESLGGRANLGETAGMCPEDLTDLVVIESPGNHGRSYALCEVCGGVWIPDRGEDEAFEGQSSDEMLDELVEFFREFGARRTPA